MTRHRAAAPAAVSVLAGLLGSLLLGLLLLGCGGDGSEPAAETSAPSTSGAGEPESPAPLQILVTNDDGVGAQGISDLVEGLEGLPAVELTVVAPAENNSGSSDSTTPSTVPVRDTTTADGVPAVAVEGFPADSVRYALDDLGLEPDLVVSGVNAGQNIGPAVELSGTIGAARTAARAGYPALAVSAGLADPVDYATAVDLALDWITEHRAELADLGGEVVSINSPSRATGEVRGLVEVPVAAGGDFLGSSDCSSSLEDPTDDVVAFTNGFATITEVGPG